MKLTRASEYAIQAVAYMAVQKKNDITASHLIAEKKGIPERFLLKVLKPLVSAQVLQSVKGPRGGYRLAKPSDLITFGQIIRLTDGPLALLPCVSHNFYRRCDDCPDEAACVLRRIMAEVRSEVSEILDRTTLADVLLSLPMV